LNCRTSLLDPSRERRHNAAELLDNLVPRELWRELVPILVRDEAAPSVASVPGSRVEILRSLALGSDPWLSACSIHVAAELDEVPGEIEAARQGRTKHPWVREAADRAKNRAKGREDGSMSAMSVVEKVVALQDVEVFRGTPPEQLALIASVASEETFAAGVELCRQGDPPGDMYVLLGGRVDVEKDGASLGQLGKGDALGTWALFEDEPWQVTASAVEASPVLRIDRAGFEDALSENPEIARGLIRQLIRRLRELAG
jgi:hypothetical protein